MKNDPYIMCQINSSYQFNLDSKLEYLKMFKAFLTVVQKMLHCLLIRGKKIDI